MLTWLFGKSGAIKGIAAHDGSVTRLVTQYWLRANGQVERFFKTLNKTIRAAQCDGLRWQESIFSFLLLYRNTPHVSTGFSPAQLLMNRDLRSKLPDLPAETYGSNQAEIAINNDKKYKQKQKFYADRKCSDISFKIGDYVLLKQKKVNKLSPNFSKLVHIIVDIKGSQIHARRLTDNKLFCRNSSFFKHANCDMGNKMRSKNLKEEDSKLYLSESGSINRDNNIDNAIPFEPAQTADFNNLRAQPLEIAIPYSIYESNLSPNASNSPEQESRAPANYLRGNPPRSCGPPNRWGYP